MRTTLTIAGSDSIAGAGIQADLKTFAALGRVRRLGGDGRHRAEHRGGDRHLRAAPRRWCARRLKRRPRCRHRGRQDGHARHGRHRRSGRRKRRAASSIPNLVVDPVMAASRARQRRTLLAPEAVSILKTRLLPLATVVTPNVAEAEALSGMRVDSLSGARDAAKRILQLGPAAVVIKGGHLSGAEAIDLLLHEGTVYRVRGAARRLCRCSRHRLHVRVCDCCRSGAGRRHSGGRPACEALHYRRDRAIVRDRAWRASPQSLLGATSSPYNRRVRHESR